MNEHKKEKQKKSRIPVVIVGLGYVGLPLAILASKKGYAVTGIVRSEEKALQINNKQSPIVDAEIQRDLVSTDLHATTEFSVIRDAEIVVVCVPTPVYDDYRPNLEPVISSCTNVGKYLQKNQLIILESTVNPGVCETTVIPILERESGLVCGRDFYVAHCPERINPGDTKWNVENIPRVVGSLESVGLQKAVEFYTSILQGSVTPMKNLKEAEAVKITENAFRDINIAFVNELALSFDRLGIDVINVINGAATKPFSFLPHYPGCGVGGHCIPVDPYYLIAYAKQFGFSHNFLSLARDINNAMPERTVDMAVAGLKNYAIVPEKATIAVLGLSYKANIDDDRESPAYHIVDELKKRQIRVRTYDPYVLHKSTHQSLEETVTGVDGVIVATAHREFLAIDPSYFVEKNISLVVDGRNCLSKEKFITVGIGYKGIGR